MKKPGQPEYYNQRVAQPEHDSQNQPGKESQHMKYRTKMQYHDNMTDRTAKIGKSGRVNQDRTEQDRKSGLESQNRTATSVVRTNGQIMNTT
jgi:hypothetical protein